MVKKAGGALLPTLNIDRASEKPLGRQLSAALRELILSGGLGAGERLPATRTIASDLSVSRTVVVEAFERLAAEGLIVSKTGAGTFISQALVNHAPPRRSPAPKRDPGAAAGACDRARLAVVPGASGACAARLHDGASGVRRLPHGAVVAPCRQALAAAARRRARLRRDARLLPAPARHRGASAGQSRHPLRAGGDFCRQRRPARLSADRRHAARSRQPRVVRESGRHRRAQLFCRGGREARARAGRPRGSDRRGGAEAGAENSGSLSSRRRISSRSAAP